VAAIEPFGTPGGGIIAPPVDVPELDRCIAWDSLNGGLAGIAGGGEGGENLEVAWRLEGVRPSMQPVVFPESGELVINDFVDGKGDDLIVVDIVSGRLIDRVSTGAGLANGMFLSPDGDGGVFYCTTGTVAHVSWRQQEDDNVGAPAAVEGGDGAGGGGGDALVLTPPPTSSPEGTPDSSPAPAPAPAIARTGRTIEEIQADLAEKRNARRR